MKYCLSRFTKIVSHDEQGITIIYNTFNGNQSYIYDKKILEQIKLLENGSVDENLLDTALMQKYCVPENTDEAELAYRRLDDHINDDKALSLIIIPTLSCNFNCKYCYEEKEPGYMSDDTFNNLYHAIKKYFSSVEGQRFLKLDWFGGEPLLCFDKVVDFTRKANAYCIKNKIAFQHSMTTNGYLLTVDKAADLIKSGIVLYQITIDGAETTHNKYRPLVNGEPTWKTIVDNLKALKDLPYAFKVQMRINYNMDVIEDLESFFDFYRTEFEDDNRFELTLHTMGHWGGSNDDSFQVFPSDYQSYMMSQLMELGLAHGVSHFAAYTPKCGGELCYANIKHSYVIYKDGSIGKCTLEEAPDKDSDFVIGNINKGFFDIDPERERKWVFTLNDLKELINGNACANCTCLPLCGGTTCPAQRIRTGIKKPKCTPTALALDELILLNYKMVQKESE